MASYRNDYSKKEDLALWTLHEIRHKIGPRATHAETINRSAKELIRKRRLTNLKLSTKSDTYSSIQKFCNMATEKYAVQ